VELCCVVFGLCFVVGEDFVRVLWVCRGSRREGGSGVDPGLQWPNDGLSIRLLGSQEWTTFRIRAFECEGILGQVCRTLNGGFFA